MKTVTMKSPFTDATSDEQPVIRRRTSSLIDVFPAPPPSPMLYYMEKRKTQRAEWIAMGAYTTAIWMAGVLTATLIHAIWGCAI